MHAVVEKEGMERVVEVVGRPGLAGSVLNVDEEQIDCLMAISEWESI